MEIFSDKSVEASEKSEKSTDEKFEKSKMGKFEESVRKSESLNAPYNFFSIKIVLEICFEMS